MGSDKPLPKVFIGYDSREVACSYVAAYSILKRTRLQPEIHFLKHRELREKKLFARPWLTHGETGETTDLIDGKTFSTEFSHTRFLVPSLMEYQGWALFMDADMIFLSDIRELFKLCDDKYAVMCVKHHYQRELHPIERLKMDKREQRIYARKNWSSFVLWNCAHPANKELTPEKVNFMTGGDLHAFSWLQEEHIGALPTTYNYISGISPRARNEVGWMPSVIHYTNGGPWFEQCQDVPYAQTWIDEYEDWQRHGAIKHYTDIASTRF